jgi:hypothetical protein
MNNAEFFSAMLRSNQGYIVEAIEGLSHAESLLQLPGESNCMNWVLGHIATFRDGMLAEVRQAVYMTEAEVKLYDYGSKPITPESKSVDFERLVELLTQTHEAISIWLQSNPDGLEKDTPQDISSRRGYVGYWDTVAEHFAQNIGHEAIHVGELSALRELALVSMGERKNSPSRDGL